MTKREIAELFKLLNAAYQNFAVNQERIDAWAVLLSDQEADQVMERAKNYCLDNKFPPAVADLRTAKLESRSNSFLSKVDTWRGEAVGFKPRS